MPRFSERIGAVKVEIQVGTMDAALRNTIWNFVTEFIPDHANNTKRHYAAIEGIVVDVLRLPKQRLDRQAPMYWLLSQVEKMTWAEVYELLEYVVGASETGNVMNIRVAQLR